MFVSPISASGKVSAPPVSCLLSYCCILPGYTIVYGANCSINPCDTETGGIVMRYGAFRGARKKQVV